MLPNELLFKIFNYVENKQDLLTCQRVCYSFLQPARESFYRTVVIREGQGHQLKDFIFKMSLKQSSNRILSPGECVKSLTIDFQIPLETQFMPTTAEFQQLAASCPNIEILNLPHNMFWNDILAIDTQQYWKKMTKISGHQIDRLFHFKDSLTSLDLLEMVDLTQFSRLETVKLSDPCVLEDIVPFLTHSNITKLIMTSNDNMLPCRLVQNNQKSAISTLGRLEITLTETSPFNTIHTILRNFPYLNHLHLSFKPHYTAETAHVLLKAMKQLAHFLNKIQSHIDIFIDDVVIMHKIVCYFNCTSLKVTYSNCSSSLTGLPAISIRQNQIIVRYQGNQEIKTLPHMQLLKQIGYRLCRLSIQWPACYLQSDDTNLYIQTILEQNCPSLEILELSQCYFHLTHNNNLAHLKYLKLEKSLITTCTHNTHILKNIKHVKLNSCFNEQREPYSIII